MRHSFSNLIKLLIAIKLLICSSALQAETSQTVSLNGIWQFTTQKFSNSASLMTANYQDWDKMAVPGNWDTQEKYSTYKGKAYYQTTFTLAENWQNKQVLLNFAAVYQTAKVWLNGELLGQHIGGYTPFEFNITQQVKFKQHNSLVVMADNTYRRGAWWAWGGISRDVSLVAKSDTRLVYQHITSRPDFEKQKVHFQVKYKLHNHSNQTKIFTLESELSDGAKASTQFNTQVRVPAKKSIIKIHSFEDDLANYTLWNTHTPHLYKLHTQLKLGDKSYDKQTDRFGIRKFEVRGEQFYLNNQAVRLNGVNRVHDHPEFGNTEPKHLLLKDMQDIKALGANFSRLMHAPLAKSLLDICDELGYLIIGEIPVWGDDDPQTFAGNPLTKQWLTEMIERDFNHPAIVGWSVGNELRDPLPPWGQKTLTPAQYEYVNSMLDHVAEQDPTRLKTYVSITAYGQHASPDNEPFAKLDFISVNSYGDAVKNVKNTHKNFPGKPIFLSEVGLKQIGGEQSARLDEKLIDYLRTLKEFPYLTGFAIWSYNDYRSDYKGTPESGFREWGVVDEKRNKKAAYYQLQDIFKYWQASPN